MTTPSPLATRVVRYLYFSPFWFCSFFFGFFRFDLLTGREGFPTYLLTNGDYSGVYPHRVAIQSHTALGVSSPPPVGRGYCEVPILLMNFSATPAPSAFWIPLLSLFPFLLFFHSAAIFDYFYFGFCRTLCLPPSQPTTRLDSAMLWISKSF